MTEQLSAERLQEIKGRVIPLALEVGRAARQRQVDHHAGRSDFHVSAKTSPGDVVTVVDVESQEWIARELRDAYPGFGLLGEEGLSDLTPGAPVWVIDPIDGTHNFVRDYPGFCVSIGLVQGGRSVLGVIYDSASGEVYSAHRGGGAWRGEERLELRDDRPLSHSLISTNFTESMRDSGPQQRFFARVSGGSAGVRASGSAARDFCFVADGRIDLFWQFGLAPWDVAAGAVLVEEAGARFELWNAGSSWVSERHLHVAAGTPRVLEEARVAARELGLITAPEGAY